MTNANIALIAGITGQDGSYPAEFLLEKGYVVHGLIRRSSQFNTQRIDHLYTDPHESPTRLLLHYADLTDSSSLIGRGDIRWDATKPDGQPRRALDTSRARAAFGFEAYTTFEDGLRKTVEFYERMAA